MVATTSHATPYLAIGDSAEIFITGTVGVRKDNNIFMSPTKQSDTIFELNPGVQLVFGNSSVVRGTFSLTEAFTLYTDHDDLNDELSSANFNANYDDGKSTVSVNASFSELNQNTVDTLPVVGTRDALIRRDVSQLGSVAEVSVTEKSSISGGVQYNRADFKRGGFSDSESVTLPFNYYYEMTPKVDMSLGYRFRQKWEGIGLDTKDHFFNVGARGEFTPKLTGNFAVGYTLRKFDGRSDESLLGIDSSLSYALSPKTSIQFGVNNDFDTNSQGQQQKNLAVRTSVSSRISEQWTVTAGVSYRAIDYYTRTDDYYEGQVGATYTASQNVSVTAGLALRSNKSDLPTSDFDARVISLAATFRF